MAEDTYKGIPKQVIVQAVEFRKHHSQTPYSSGDSTLALPIALFAINNNLPELKAWCENNRTHGRDLLDAVEYYIQGGLPDGATDEPFDL